MNSIVKDISYLLNSNNTRYIKNATVCTLDDSGSYFYDIFGQLLHKTKIINNEREITTLLDHTVIIKDSVMSIIHYDHIKLLSQNSVLVNLNIGRGVGSKSFIIFENCIANRSLKLRPCSIIIKNDFIYYCGLNGIMLRKRLNKNEVLDDPLLDYTWCMQNTLIKKKSKSRCLLM